MATFTVNKDVHAQIGPFAFDIAAGATQSCPDDLFDEVESILERTPGVVVTFGAYDRTGTEADLTAHEIAANPHTVYALDSDLTTHEAAADPHTVYQKESEKAQANGYASLDGSTLVPVAQIGTGSPDSTKVLHGDRVFRIISAASSDSGAVRNTGGGKEVVSIISAAGSATTLDLANGNVFDVGLNTATCTLTITGSTNGSACSIDIVLTQDSAGGRTVAWPAAFQWPGGQAPILSSVASAVDVVTAFTLNGGTTWRGFHATGTPRINQSATTAPTINDDIADGYTVGSQWFDVTNDKSYACLDATAGAAVWKETSNSASTAFVGVKAYHNTTQATGGVDIALLMNSEEYDTDGFHSTSVNTTRVTIPAGLGGRYLINGNSFAGGGSTRLYVRKNGTTKLRMTSNTAAAAAYMTISGTAELAESDYVELVGAGNQTYGDGTEEAAQTSLALTFLGS